MALSWWCFIWRWRLPPGLKFHGIVDLRLTSKLSAQHIKFSLADDHIRYSSRLLVIKVNIFNSILEVDSSIFNFMDGKLVHEIAVLREGLQGSLDHLNISIAGVVGAQEKQPRGDDLAAHNKLTTKLALEMLVVCGVGRA
jgi:hypothetical protein